MEGKNIDKLFKNKLDSKEVLYDPTNWAKMSVFLDENPIARKTPVGNYLIAGLILAIVLLTGVYYYALPRAETENRKVKPIFVNPIISANSSENTSGTSSSVSGHSTDVSINSESVSDAGGLRIEKDYSEILTGNSSMLSLEAIGDYLDFEDESEGINSSNRQQGKKTSKLSLKHSRGKIKGNVVKEHEDEDLNSISLTEEERMLFSSSQEVQEEIEPLLTLVPEEVSSSFFINMNIDNSRRRLLLNGKKIRPFIDAYLGTGFMARPDHLLIKGGVSIGIELNPSIFLRTGITFANQNTPSHAGYSFEKAVFGFGRDFDIYELQVDKTNSMSIPVEIGFRKNRHAIFAGVEIEKILASKGKFHLYPSGDAKILKESGWVGNRAFLPEPTWNFLLGYEYYIGSKTIIGVRLESAMSNYISIKDEEAFRAPGASNWGRAIFQVRQKF